MLYFLKRKIETSFLFYLLFFKFCGIFDIVKRVGVNMSEVVNFLFGLGATIFMGVCCAFLILLNSVKEEFWGEIYERISSCN